MRWSPSVVSTVESASLNYPLGGVSSRTPPGTHPPGMTPDVVECVASAVLLSPPDPGMGRCKDRDHRAMAGGRAVVGDVVEPRKDWLRKTHEWLRNTDSCNANSRRPKRVA